jgi:hypothetical protein
MNVFNRVIVIVSILVWLAVAVVIMLLPVDAADLAVYYIGQFRQAVFGSLFYTYLMAVGGAKLLVLLILLWLEVRRPHSRTARIKIKGGGTARLEVGSVAQSLEYRIDELAGVRKVHPRIASRGRDVAVRIDLDTSPSVNIPVLTSQIIDMAHDIIEGQLGVKIHGKVEINVKHEPYPRGTMPSTGPLGEEPVTVPPGRELAANRATKSEPVTAASAFAADDPEPRPVAISPARESRTPEAKSDKSADNQTSNWK